MQIKNILVVCVGNICRSPMAEYFLKEAHPDLHIESAGLSAMVGHAADDKAIDCMNAKNIEMIKHYNPFELQNRQIPFYLSLIFIIVPIIYSFFIKNIKALIYNCIFFLSIPILTSFLWRVIIHGWNNSLYNSYTDISYFNLLLPFIVFILAYDFKSILDNK